MLKRKGLFALTMACALVGIVGCTPKPVEPDPDDVFEQEDKFEKELMTLSLVGDLKNEAYPVWDPKGSSEIEALRLNYVAEESLYRVTIDITAGAQLKVVNGVSWGSGDWGYGAVDLAKSSADKIEDAGGNIGIVTGGTMTVEYYEFAAIMPDKIENGKTLIVTIK